MSKIENCKFAFKCPQRWESMNATDNVKVRHCQQCHKNVYLADTQEELNKNIEQGLCTAIFELDIGYATAGVISVDSYTGDTQAFTIYLGPIDTLTVAQIKVLKQVMVLEENFLQVKNRFEGTQETKLFDLQFEDAALEIVRQLKQAGLKCRLEERPLT